MALQFLIDLLTGNLVLVEVIAATVPAKPKLGMPMGLLLALTYPVDQ